jgi:release factor glutamine methyltransferase
VTILEVIQRSAGFLAKKGVESPRLQVELLLAHVLKMPRMNLYLNFERPLAPVELDALRTLVQRRGQREPLQHIVGSVSFCGLEVSVNRHVLIPRPETELLAERAWKFLQSVPDPSALDLCTGSGCLAIALAAHVPTARICATDLSGEALAVARENVERHKFGERIELRQGDGFAAVESQSKFSLMVSNPPYIPSAEVEKLEPEVRHYEPRTALDGGGDGLDFYRRIAAEAGGFLHPGGRVMVELEEDGAEGARHIFASERWKIEALEMDDNRKPRILIARAPD